MKKIYVFLSITLLIISCNNEDLEFSCNPAIDEFVRLNIIELSLISYEEFLKFNSPVQRAVFRSYSPEKKFEIWYEKLDIILESVDWTELELMHIESLKNNLCLEYFMEKDESDTIIVKHTAFADNWIQYASDNLNWNERRVAFIVSSLYCSEADYEYSLSQLKDIVAITGESSEGNCNCNTGSDFCDYGQNCTSGCNATSSGCGWLWMQSCNGYCL